MQTGNIPPQFAEQYLRLFIKADSFIDKHDTKIPVILILKDSKTIPVADNPPPSLYPPTLTSMTTN